MHFWEKLIKDKFVFWVRNTQLNLLTAGQTLLQTKQGRITLNKAKLTKIY